LQERNRSGEGQQIDISLFDSQVSALVNVASSYLISGQTPQPFGNTHPNIVPYQVFSTRDQALVVAVGNDHQFSKFASIIGMPELAENDKFRTNPKRVEHREELIGIVGGRMKEKTAKEWQRLLRDAGIPNGPINDLQTLFEDPQIQAREMVIEMPHPTANSIKLVGSPLKLSRSPVEMRRHPPLFGEHTRDTLLHLGYSEQQIEEMKKRELI
jgi:crotonobetainyl-CoA:carnitine CoA-transferase CaiB-like acyl-CoA transferase